MKIRAFILIKTDPGKAKGVVNALEQLEEVKSADQVTGPYDIIVVLERESLVDIGESINGRIKLLPYISKVVSCMSLN
jgi:DNA-binding Lrp family transcriptional regulator